MVRSKAYDWTRAGSRQWPAAAALAALVGCGGSNVASDMVEVPEFKPAGQSKCKVTKSSNRPLIVEWPSADRGALEAQMKKGVVAVRYLGCEMQVLRRCTVSGERYAYIPLTPKEDHIRIRNADELYASIPVYAAKFESKLETAGELEVDMTIVGSYETQQHSIHKDELEGDCRGATHFIYAITTGAFEFAAVGSAGVGAGVEAAGVEAGGHSSAEREMLNRDGYKKACESATNADETPPDGCGALLRVEVVTLDEARVDPEPDEPEPDEPEPVADGPDEPEPDRPKPKRIEPDEPDEPAIGPGVARIHVQSDEPVQMFRYKPLVTPVATQVVTLGPSASSALHTAELICTAPCKKLVDGREGQQFFFAGEGIPESDKFQIHDKEGDLLVKVDAGSSSGLYWGWMSTIGGASLGIGGAIWLATIVSADTSTTTEDTEGPSTLPYAAVSTGVGAGLLTLGIVLLSTMGTDFEFVDQGQVAAQAPPQAPPFAWQF